MPQPYEHKQNSCHEHTSVQTGYVPVTAHSSGWVFCANISGLVATQRSVAAAVTRSLAHWLWMQSIIVIADCVRYTSRLIHMK